MGGERVFKNINMVSEPAICFYLSGGGSTLIIFLEGLEKEKKKTQPLCEGGVLEVLH